jgi:hypothetical protein
MPNELTEHRRSSTATLLTSHASVCRVDVRSYRWKWSISSLAQLAPCAAATLRLAAGETLPYRLFDRGTVPKWVREGQIGKRMASIHLP